MDRIGTYGRFSLTFSGVWSLLVVAWATCNFVYFRYFHSLAGSMAKLDEYRECRFVHLWLHDVGGRNVVFDVDFVPLEILIAVLFPSFVCIMLGAVLDKYPVRMWQSTNTGMQSRMGPFTKFSLVFGGVWALVVVAWAIHKLFDLQSMIGQKKKIWMFASRFVETVPPNAGTFDEVSAVSLLPLEIVVAVMLPAIVGVAVGVVADRIAARRLRDPRVAGSG